MQELVARYPELISDGDGELLLIRREEVIRDSEDSAGRWSVVHLFVTRDAVPVLVELKRAIDTRLRREVAPARLKRSVWLRRPFRNRPWDTIAVIPVRVGRSHHNSARLHKCGKPPRLISATSVS